jgi:hypothetical protein
MIRISLKLSELSMVDNVGTYHYLDAPTSFVVAASLDWVIIMPFGIPVQVPYLIEATAKYGGELMMFQGTVIAMTYSSGCEYVVEYFCNN